MARNATWLNEEGQPQFYTRGAIRHIVRYAMDRGIRVVPELDFPSHMGGLKLVLPHLTGE